jgi:hypothetical protein
MSAELGISGGSPAVSVRYSEKPAKLLAAGSEVGIWHLLAGRTDNGVVNKCGATLSAGKPLEH